MFVTRTDQSIRVGSANAGWAGFLLVLPCPFTRLKKSSWSGEINVRRGLRREQRTSHERSCHNEDNGRFADYFIHLLLGVKLRDAPVGSTIWIQRI